MKRSEMVSLILKEIEYYENNIMAGEETNNLLANAILTKMEEAGMQPPNITLEELFPNSELEADTKDYYACWEPEEDELEFIKAVQKNQRDLINSVPYLLVSPDLTDEEVKTLVKVFGKNKD